MINIVFEIKQQTGLVDQGNKLVVSDCDVDLLFTGPLKFKVGDIDYGGDLYILTFLSDMFMMLLDCLCLGKHAIGGIIDETRDISLRPSETLGKMYIGHEFKGKILDEQEVFIDDLTRALGKAYTQLIADADRLYPELKDTLKFKGRLLIGF